MKLTPNDWAVITGFIFAACAIAIAWCDEPKWWRVRWRLIRRRWSRLPYWLRHPVRALTAHLYTRRRRRIWGQPAPGWHNFKVR